MTSKITLDEYRYEEIYPSFKAATDEKVLTANLNRKFLLLLRDAGIVLAGNAPVRVADIGSGPCDTIVKYLSGLDFAPGFIIRATDSNPIYADPVHGAAAAALNAVKLAGAIPLIDFAVKPGDAFAGKLLDLLSTNSGKTPSSFRLIYASHMFYHAEDPHGCERLLADIVKNVMARDGVCVLYHLANSPGTFQHFRSRYGRKPRRGLSDTPALAVIDPPAAIAECCSSLGIPLADIEFSARLQFGSLRGDDWEAIKDPENFADLSRRIPGAYDDLKRLLFIVQRAPREFAADKSMSGLDAFIDEIRPVMESGGGCLPLAEAMQIMWHPDASAGFKRKIREIIAILREN
ncbi:MAG: hypothetical protein ACREP6_16045 [Candidatus Binataceae bacterium]